MISWYWLIPAAIIGATLGVMALAMCSINSSISNLDEGGADEH